MNINLPASLAVQALAVLNTASADESPARFTGGVLVNAKGLTLYTYLSIQKPGERSGDGFKGVWHVIKE